MRQMELPCRGFGYWYDAGMLWRGIRRWYVVCGIRGFASMLTTLVFV